MKVGYNGKQLFKDWEGKEPEVYIDSGGVPTIGIGHALTKSERTSGKIVIGNVEGDYREGLTEDQIWQLLDQDLAPAEKAVNSLVRVPLNQNEFDALVSFVFNVGRQAFEGSTLLKVLNQSQYHLVPEQLRRWVFDNGVQVQGLVNRREKEIALWLSAVPPTGQEEIAQGQSDPVSDRA